MKQHRFFSIFRKQLLLVCLFALMLATGTSLYQFFTDQALRHRQDDAGLRQLLMVSASPLKKLLNHNHLKEAEEYLGRLFSFPPILSIKLIDPHGKEAIKLQRKPEPPASSWTERRLFRPNHWASFPLNRFDPSISRPKISPSWTIELKISESQNQRHPIKYFLIHLVANFALCLLFILSIYLLLFRFFSRQIAALNDQLKNFRFSAGKPLNLKVGESDQNDEIRQLATSINDLGKIYYEQRKTMEGHNQFVTTVTSISPVGLFRTDKTGGLIWYNQKTKVLLGILGYEKKLEEWLGNLLTDRQTEIFQSWQVAINNEKPFHAELPLKQADNQTCWVICEATPSWSEGHFEGYVGTLTDVTLLRQATLKLHESEERYQAITQTASSAIILTEARGQICYWNPAAKRIFGYNRRQALGQNLSTLIIPEQSRKTFAEACPEYTEQSDEVSGHLAQLEACTQDGRIVQVEISLSSFKMAEAWHTAMIISDIGKRITAEKERTNLLDQLRQSQKMEAIGTLAGGIAHDFNNILTPILGFGQLLQSTFAAETKERSRIDKIVLSANRAKDLVGQILSFSRKSKEEERPTLVVPVVKESLKLLRAGIPTTISIKTRIPSTDFWVLAAPTRIHQILMNLATNAVQAMDEKGGTLTFIVDQFTPATERYPQLNRSAYLRLTISDTGPGIDQHTRERIFDPYFTTKGADSGTGLGLAVVQSGVKALGGIIEVESEVGEGATFRVLLPLISGEFQRRDKQPHALPHGGGQHLLLVDDEMSLVNIGREFLEDLGYRVTGITNSREALGTFAKDPESFDMLITDQTMPRLTGLELARQARKLHPTLPVIICTGQRNLLDDRDLEQVDVLKVLVKPDLFNNLATILKEYFSTPPVR